jgi:hypothetical protein
MNSFHTLPSEWQYVILALSAAVGTFVVLWSANRVQARRKRACELAKKLSEWGMTKLAEPLDAYSHGDYSEAIHGFVQLAKEMQTTAGAVSLIETAVIKAVTYYASNNATKAQEILAILKNGSAAKTLFSDTNATPATAATNAS